MHLTILYKKNRKISDSLQSHIDTKMELIEHSLEEDHPVHLSLSSQKDGEHAELTFHFKGHDIIAKTIKETLFESIDESVALARRQLKKIEDKSHHGKGSASLKHLVE